MQSKATATKLLTVAILASIAISAGETERAQLGGRGMSNSGIKVREIAKEDNITIIQAISRLAKKEDVVLEDVPQTELQEDQSSSVYEDTNTVITDAEELPDADKEESIEVHVKSWFEANRSKILNGVIIVVGFALLGLISYKYYSINASIKEKHAQIQDYAHQLETIIEGTDKLVFATYKDQKENIQFIDNPAYKKKSQGELTKAQQIQAEIAKVEEDIKKKEKDIDNLRSKESYYDKEIDQLEQELDVAKTRVLDEGAALGFAETVLREFK